MSSRFAGRIDILVRAAAAVLRTAPRAPRAQPRRILIAHHLLLGDTLMLTPLLAKLRQRYPEAEIVMTVAPAFAPLYATRPYGVSVAPFDPRNRATLQALWPLAGFDLALVPGDNRHSWLARALRSRWIVAFAGDRPAYKSWPVDDAVPYPAAPGAWGDMGAALVAGAAAASLRARRLAAAAVRSVRSSARRPLLRAARRREFAAETLAQ